MKYSALYLFALLLIFSGVSCKKNNIETNQPETAFCIPDSLMKNLTIDTVQSKQIDDELKLTGRITFNEEGVVKIYPVASGRITDVKVSLGDYVKKNQVLAVVRSSDMAEYYNEFKSTQAEMQLAKKNLDVTSDLQSSGVSSEKDLLSAQSDYQKAKAHFNKINEVLNIYGRASDPNDSIGSAYIIKAPVDGFIVEKNINSGMDLRMDDAQNMFTISDFKEVWALANVYETDLANIKTGNEVAVTSLTYPDKQFKGKIETISNVINPETHSLTAKIKLQNVDYSLKPGMLINVSVFMPSDKTMLTVPAKSVLFDDKKNYIVVYRKQCDLELRPVVVFKTFEGVDYIIDDSLKAGDRLITQNNLFVFSALKKL